VCNTLRGSNKEFSTLCSACMPPLQGMPSNIDGVSKGVENHACQASGARRHTQALDLSRFSEPVAPRSGTALGGREALWGQTWPTHPVTVDRRITPPTAASERSMIVSCHAAPQCADAYHAYQPGDTPCVPGFSRHGNVHVRLGGCYNVSSVGLH
jgi:hypothetical protein